MRPQMLGRICSMSVELFHRPSQLHQSWTSGKPPDPGTLAVPATVAARDMYDLATGESGYFRTIGSPPSPHSATRGSIGNSPRKGTLLSRANFIPPPTPKMGVLFPAASTK